MVKKVNVIQLRTLKNIVVTTAGTVFAFVLPMSGAGQSEPVLAEEPPNMIEEVIVFGSKPLVELELELYRAEDALYGLFNSFNTDDDLDVQCYKAAPVGSHIKQRVCKTKLYRELLAKASQRMMQGEHYVYPVAEIAQMNERLLADMTETALQQPDMLKALIRATEAKQALESERKRRCEGSFLFCW
jgi:hypothetical protein